VDDPRNTDNAWIETVAYNFHDEGQIFKNINLIAGDDAKTVKWVDIDAKLKLYANHKEFIYQVAKKLNAHW
jgi:ADP-ribose pyrophosphatase